MKNRYCVIMAGGIGSRFWPLSQKEKPKQFIDILSSGKSMIRDTYERFLPLVPKENILILTNTAYRDMVMEHIPDIDPKQVLCEPLKRNTAPCIAYATHHIYSLNKNAVMVVTPSDHYIGNKALFNTSINDCFEMAEKESVIMTIGIRPTRPETGYGYIQLGKNNAGSIYKVKTFTEKPDIEMAKVFLESDEFLWNSGMFIWSCDTILEAFELYTPNINSVFREGEKFYNTPNEQEFVNKVFSSCESISIDYAVMEKAKNVYVYDANFVWSDIGAWKSLYEHMEKDDNSNAVDSKNIKLFNTKDSIIKSDSDKPIVIDGLEGYVVIDNEKGLLICPLSNENKIRRYLDK